MRCLPLALLSVSAFAQSYSTFGEGFSLSEGENRLQVSSRMHTAPSLHEFLQTDILVDWLEVYPIEIRFAAGETYSLSQLRVTAYGPDGSIKEHIPLTFNLEGPSELLDFEDWRVHGETILGVSPGTATIWVESLANSSTGARVALPIRLTVT
jgi:hypothetical protein